jgi:hypothetical protein
MSPPQGRVVAAGRCEALPGLERLEGRGGVGSVTS